MAALPLHRLIHITSPHPHRFSTRQLLRDKQVKFAGYIHPHPLLHKIEVRVQTVDRNVSTPMEALENALSDLNQEFTGLKSRFQVCENVWGSGDVQWGWVGGWMDAAAWIGLGGCGEKGRMHVCASLCVMYAGADSLEKVLYTFFGLTTHPPPVAHDAYSNAYLYTH